MASFWYKGYSVQVFCCQCKSDVICFMWCWWRDPIFCVWSSIFPLLLEWRKHKETGNKRLQWNFYNSVHQKDIKGVGLIPPLLLHMTASNKLLQCDANGCPISAECAAQQNIQTCPMKVYRLGTNGTLPWAGTQRLSIVTRERQRLLPMGQQATGRTNSWITQYQSPKHSVQPSQHVYFIGFFYFVTFLHIYSMSLIITAWFGIIYGFTSSTLIAMGVLLLSLSRRRCTSDPLFTQGTKWWVLTQCCEPWAIRNPQGAKEKIPGLQGREETVAEGKDIQSTSSLCHYGNF